MEDKKLILILAIIVIAIAAVGVILIASQNDGNQSQSYTTLALSNTSTIEVPITTKALKSSDDYGIMYYVDEENDLNITSFNSAEGSTLPGAMQMASIRDTVQLGSTPIVTQDNITVYQNPDTKVYSIFTGNDTTHDNILIVSGDLDTLIHAYKSIAYGEIDFEDNTDTSKSNTNSSDRFVEDENGLFDTEKGVYVGGQFDGSTKEDVAQYYYDIEHEADYYYYDDYSESQQIPTES